MRLRLYVADNSPASARARAHLEALCRRYLPGAYALEVIDVWLEPDRALADDVWVTPTLKKIAPPPAAVIWGDLTNTADVLAALGIDPDQGAAAEKE
jgi:circadian clock protein KaiB